MAKGDALKFPICRLCSEEHRIEPGKVCPKFRSKKTIDQPKPKLLAAPRKKS